MKNNGKIRSNIVKESLVDYNNLVNTLKENTDSIVKDVLRETVLEEYTKLLNEGDEEYDVEEVNDTDSVNASEDESAAEGEDEVTDGDDEGMESDATDAEGDSEGDDETADDLSSLDSDDTDAEDDIDDNDNEWSEFDKYKVSDGKYDFSNAEDDEIVKVYKLLKDDDQVVVNKQDNKVNITDNETGAEYLIDLGSSDKDDAALTDTDEFSVDVLADDDSDSDDDSDAEIELELDDDSDIDDDSDSEDDLENQEDEDMTNESKVFEIALNEYDSNVGYTDNYQNKDVMTNPGMSEPGKNVNDWDKGVPKDARKPWSGKNNSKKENQPFAGGIGKTVEEDEDFEQPVNELKSVEEHGANNMSTSRTDGSNNPRNRKGRNFHTAQNGQEKGTAENPYSNASNESIKRKAEKIFKENKQLKFALNKFRQTLEEAALTNVNLGNIVKLVMENSTSMDEKKEIIQRFGTEVKNVAESKGLYESISRDLKKKDKMSFDGDKPLTVNENRQLNETQIYRSDEILNSLDLMHRICK